MRSRRGGASGNTDALPLTGIFGEPLHEPVTGPEKNDGAITESPTINSTDIKVHRDLGNFVEQYFRTVLDLANEKINDEEPASESGEEVGELISMNDIMTSFAVYLEYNRDFDTFSIDYTKLVSDISTLAAAAEIGSIYVREKESDEVSQFGGSPDAVDGYLMTLNGQTDLKKVAEVVTNFEKSVHRASDIVALDKQCLLPLIRLAITTVAASDTSTDSENHLLVNALTGGVSIKSRSNDTEKNVNTQAILIEQLGLKYSHSLAELLILNIVTKNSPRHSLYNASYLYAINTGKKSTQIGWIEDKESRNYIIIESGDQIRHLVKGNKTGPSSEPGMYEVFLPSDLLPINDVVHGNILKNRYTMLSVSAFNKAIEKLNNVKFMWTLDTLSGILPLSSFSYTDNPDLKRLEIMSKLHKTRGDVYGKESRRFNLFYLIAHGRMTNEMVNSPIIPDTKRQKITVPSNVVMVRKGMIGCLTAGKAILDSVCDTNINLLATSWEETGLACDIIPPGHSIPNVFLTGGRSDTETRKLGYINCLSKQIIKFEPGSHRFLDQVVEEISKTANETGYPALLVTGYCQRTENVQQVYEGLLANFRALEQLPSKLIYLGHKEGSREINVPRIISASSEVRLAHLNTPMRLSLAKTLQMLKEESRSLQHGSRGGAFPSGGAVNYGLVALLFVITVTSSLIGAV